MASRWRSTGAQDKCLRAAFDTERPTGGAALISPPIFELCEDAPIKSKLVTSSARLQIPETLRSKRPNANDPAKAARAKYDTERWKNEGCTPHLQGHRALALENVNAPQFERTSRRFATRRSIRTLKICLRGKMRTAIIISNAIILLCTGNTETKCEGLHFAHYCTYFKMVICRRRNWLA
jgi:hypothetical protein